MEKNKIIYIIIIIIILIIFVLLGFVIYYFINNPNNNPINPNNYQSNKYKTGYYEVRGYNSNKEEIGFTPSGSITDIVGAFVGNNWQLDTSSYYYTLGISSGGNISPSNPVLWTYVNGWKPDRTLPIQCQNNVRSLTRTILTQLIPNSQVGALIPDSGYNSCPNAAYYKINVIYAQKPTGYNLPKPGTYTESGYYEVIGYNYNNGKYTENGVSGNAPLEMGLTFATPSTQFPTNGTYSLNKNNAYIYNATYETVGSMYTYYYYSTVQNNWYVNGNAPASFSECVISNQIGSYVPNLICRLLISKYPSYYPLNTPVFSSGPYNCSQYYIITPIYIKTS